MVHYQPLMENFMTNLYQKTIICCVRIDLQNQICQHLNGHLFLGEDCPDCGLKLRFPFHGVIIFKPRWMSLALKEHKRNQFDGNRLILIIRKFRNGKIMTCIMNVWSEAEFICQCNSVLSGNWKATHISNRCFLLKSMTTISSELNWTM